MIEKHGHADYLYDRSLRRRAGGGAARGGLCLQDASGRGEGVAARSAPPWLSGSRGEAAVPLAVAAVVVCGVWVGTGGGYEEGRGRRRSARGHCGAIERDESRVGV